MKSLGLGEIKECIECIKIAQKVGEKDYNTFTSSVLKKLEEMYIEEENYQLRD